MESNPAVEKKLKAFAVEMKRDFPHVEPCPALGMGFDDGNEDCLTCIEVYKDYSDKCKEFYTTCYTTKKKETKPQETPKEEKPTVKPKKPKVGQSAETGWREGSKAHKITAVVLAEPSKGLNAKEVTDALKDVMSHPKLRNHVYNTLRASVVKGFLSSEGGRFYGPKQ